ncbi:MAG: leucyl/phenylalanyl-tRNA--protein transferase [Burkholderiales bacterium]
MISWLAGDDPFPPVSRALAEPNGLLAAGGDLTLPRLLEAYALGIFPWYQKSEPILWWSPDPRMVLFPNELKVSRSLAKTLRKKQFDVRMDTAFPDVIAECAKSRGNGERGTWITPAMKKAYIDLFRAGFAHSIETYCDGELAGGLYGVSLGRVFFGESMFYRRRDASKIALVYCMRQLQRWNFGVLDCQMESGHLVSMGARLIPRREFARLLEELVHYPAPSVWAFDDELLK